MTARRLALLAAALVIAASEYALWRSHLDTLAAVAAVSRRVDEHRCPQSPASPVPGEGDHLTARMPVLEQLVQPAPKEDPALEEPHRAHG